MRNLERLTAKELSELAKATGKSKKEMKSIIGGADEQITAGVKAEEKEKRKRKTRQLFQDANTDKPFRYGASQTKKSPQTKLKPWQEKDIKSRMSA